VGTTQERNVMQYWCHDITFSTRDQGYVFSDIKLQGTILLLNDSHINTSDTLPDGVMTIDGHHDHDKEEASLVLEHSNADCVQESHLHLAVATLVLSAFYAS
jgi:uncharacterized protein YlzI (FlbEa/FlbD family)